jgi:hypothetical protein
MQSMSLYILGVYGKSGWPNGHCVVVLRFIGQLPSGGDKLCWSPDGKAIELIEGWRVGQTELNDRAHWQEKRLDSNIESSRSFDWS